MTIASLKSLALAATRPCDSDTHFGDCAACNAKREVSSALSPERVLAMIACIEAADAMRDAGVALGQDCVTPPGISETRAVNMLIGIFDGPLQRKYDAARARMSRSHCSCAARSKCEHDYSQYLELPDGGTAVCAKCGMQAIQEAMWE